MTGSYRLSAAPRRMSGRSPRRRWIPVLAGLVLLAGASAGCSSGTADGATIPSTEATVSPGGNPAKDACQKIDKADTSDLVALQAIGGVAMQAGDNGSISIAGRALHDAAARAIQGQAMRDPDASSMTDDAAGDARFLRKTCVDQHLLPS